MPSPIIMLGVIVAWISSLFVVGGWQRGEGVDRERLVWVQKQHAQEAAARVREQALFNQLETARNESIRRETINRAALAAADRAASGLRDTIIHLKRQLPKDSAEACRITADAALTVFGECASEYRALAEIADRHANDAMTCLAGWPGRIEP